MTDHDEYGDPRAEAAFRNALERAAEEFEPVPMEPEAASGPGRRGGWPRIVAAAAAVALVVGGTAYGVAQWGGDDTGDQGPAVSAGPLPGAQPGWHWETYRDVAVQVPDSWQLGHAPNTDWCAGYEDRFDGSPFVDLQPYDAVLDIGCFGDGPAFAGDLGIVETVPERLWAPFVQFSSGSDPLLEPLDDGTHAAGGWTRIVRTVGAGRVAVLTDAANLETAHEIASSARQFTVDALGCAVSSAIQEGLRPRPGVAFDITAIETVDAMTLCQYDLGAEPGDAGLVGSRRLDSATAQEELEAIKKAPTGSGPNRPQNCSHDHEIGDTGIVLHLETDGTVRDLYVYYSSCVDNGFDDGTTQRELTFANCRPLWGDRVQMTVAHQGVAQACSR